MSVAPDPTLLLTPQSAGLKLTAVEFDSAEFEQGWRYELINGVVVVNAAPLPQERSPNELLAFVLMSYQRNHPEGKNLDYTLPEHPCR